MPLVIPEGFASAIVRFSHPSTPVSPVTVTFGVELADVPDLEGAAGFVANEWLEAIAPFVDDETTMEVLLRTGEEPDIEEAIADIGPGGNNGAFLPPNDCALVSKRTAKPGRSHRG